MPLTGTTQTLTASFYDSVNGPLEDPDSLVLTITREGVTIIGPLGLDDVVRDGVGQYHYDWVIGAQALEGEYAVTWTADMPGDSEPSMGFEIIDVERNPVPGFWGCDWPIDAACETEEWLSFPEDVRQRAVSMASATLSRLTGGRVTSCVSTVRPDLRGRFCGSGGWRSGYLWGSQYTRTLTSYAGTLDARRVRLPAPVGRIVEVEVGDAIIDPTMYEVRGNDLVWLGSVETIPWPAVPEMYAPLGAPNTFAVHYINGYEPDGNAAYAMGLMALEFARACTKGKKCSLPPGVTTIVRQGVTLEIPSGAFPGGLTGIREIDGFIAIWNPRGLVQRPQVLNVDSMRR